MSVIQLEIQNDKVEFFLTLLKSFKKEIIRNVTITDNNAKKSHSNKSWQSFIEGTYGSFANAPIRRGDQGQYETRETLE